MLIKIRYTIMFMISFVKTLCIINEPRGYFLYTLCRYVWSQKVWFFSHFGYRVSILAILVLRRIWFLHPRGAFHSTKYSGLKFRVFHARNVTVFSVLLDHSYGWTNPSQVFRFQVLCENTKSNGGLFYLCLLALGLLDDAEVETNDVLGEGDKITFIIQI